MPSVTTISGPTNVNLQVGSAATVTWGLANAYELAGPWVISGTVPAGMTIVAAGGGYGYTVTLSGTPTTAGSTTVTLKWTDGIRGNVFFNVSIQVATATSTVALLPGPMYQATVGVALSWTCDALLYPAPSPTGFAWSVSGSLPPGLSGVAAGDNSSYTLSGTPTTAGDYTFTLVCVETTSGNSRGGRITVTLTVGTTAPADPVYDPYTTPALGTTAEYANWTDGGQLGPFQYGNDIYAVTGNGISKSTDGGATWSLIAGAYAGQPANFAASETKIYVIYQIYDDGSSTYINYLDTFDMVTGAWVESVPNIFPATADSSYYIVAVRPDGKVRAIITHETGTFPATYVLSLLLVDYTPGGGVPAPITAFTESSARMYGFPQSFYVHPDGATTVFLSVSGAGYTVVLKSLYIDSDGVGSTLVSVPGVEVVGDVFDTGMPTYSDGVLYLPVRDITTPIEQAYIARASGDLTSPTWSTTQLSVGYQAEYLTSLLYNGSVHVYSTLEPDTVVRASLQMGDWVVTPTGHTGPSIIYDYQDNPPAFSSTVPTSHQFLHTLSSAALPNGQYGFVVGMEDDAGCTSVVWIGNYATPAGPSSVIPPAAAPFVFFNDECIVRLVSWGGSVTDVKPFVHVGIDVEP